MGCTDGSQLMFRARERPRWPLVCWACEELLALRSATGQLVLDADAELTESSGTPAIACRCGAVTMLSPPANKALPPAA